MISKVPSTNVVRSIEVVQLGCYLLPKKVQPKIKENLKTKKLESKKLMPFKENLEILKIRN